MSREKILAAIRQNKPSAEGLPEMPVFERPGYDVLAHFKEMSEKVGAVVYQMQPAEDINAVIRSLYPEAKSIYAAPNFISIGTVHIAGIQNPKDLNKTDLTILQGEWGVAENGAIWISDANLPHRAAIVMGEHTVLLLHRHHIVPDMHEAYRRIKVNATGYGVFISGPSKTADIEQALVIGAQGARSLAVIIQ